MVGDDFSLFIAPEVEDYLFWLLDSLPVFFAASSIDVEDVGYLEHLNAFCKLRGEETVHLLD